MSKSIKLLREQKEEYLEHLFDIIYEPCIHIYQGLYKDAMNSKEYNAKNILKLFQKELANIPHWNQLKVDEAYQTVLSHSKCSYFPDLLKTVYILTIKIILLGIPEENRNKVKVKIPSPDSFIHRCLIHIARELWKRPYLFYHEARSLDRQNNIYNCEIIIRKKLRAVIRETIPMEWMVSQFKDMDHIQEESDPDSESDTESEEEDDTSNEFEETEHESESETSEEEEEPESETSEEEEVSEPKTSEGEEEPEETSDSDTLEAQEEEAEPKQEESESEEVQLEKNTEEENVHHHVSEITKELVEVPLEQLTVHDDVVVEQSEPVNIILPKKNVTFENPIQTTICMSDDISSSDSTPLQSDSESDTDIIKVEHEEHPVQDIVTVRETVGVDEPPKKLIHIEDPHRKKHKPSKKRDAFF